MASVQLSTASPEAIDVVIKYHTSSQEPVYVSADANNWQPQQMKPRGDAFEHVMSIPRSTRFIHYKFRIGDSNWVHDDTNPAEPDGFGGYNNTFYVPEVPVQEYLNDFDEDTEVESVAAVESIADTASEAGADDARSNGEPELLDFDVDDPEYPAFLHSQSSASSLPEWFGFGLQRRF